MSRKLYKEIPQNFKICQHADCPRAATCLHQVVYQPLMERNDFLNLTNPNRYTKDTSCPYFRDAAPVTYARGFIDMQQQMLPQYMAFMSILRSRFGYNPYYEHRRGGNASPAPRAKKIVTTALRKVGVTENLKFDGYEENINWYD